MIDIHSHILFDIDDGARDMDESVRMIHAAGKEGIKVIIATPHFREHMLNPEKTYDNYRILLEKTRNIGIDLKLGFEIALNPILAKAVNIVDKHSLNATKYVLVEFPYFGFSEHSFKLLDLFQKNKFKQIIAHPERNGRGFGSKRTISKLKELGYLIQVNAGSIAGTYGVRAKGMAKYLIKNKIADFVASDAHRESYYSWYSKAWQNVIKWSDEDYANKLFYENGKKILNTM
ncbi:MAG TPA: hypothetical protein PK733_17515 [Clostridiales bacterium]|nr:hypothetical protein [Clostridiales bacterium]